VVDMVHPMMHTNVPTRRWAPRVVPLFLAAAMAFSCMYSIREVASASLGATHAISNIVAEPVTPESIPIDYKITFASIPLDY
jgi:hypothetical protein